MKLTIILLISFTVLLVALLPHYGPAEAGLDVLFGWLIFLWRVGPQVSIDWPSIWLGLAALLLLIVGVHGLGRWWSRQSPQRPRWRLRWSVALVTSVFLLFAAGVSMIGAVHKLVWLGTRERPLVGQMLKSAAHGQVGNNFTHLRIALDSSFSEPQSLPPGGTFTADGEGLHSWETHLLFGFGYYHNIDFKLPWRDPKHVDSFRALLWMFINPGFRTAELRDAEGFGLSHFAANQWVMGPNRAMKRSEITDGLANTLLIGEVNMAFQLWGHPVNYRDPAHGIQRSPSGFGGPPGTGGARFLMADGSVRFVAEKTNAEVLKALATPCGGESVQIP